MCIAFIQYIAQLATTLEKRSAMHDSLIFSTCIAILLSISYLHGCEACGNIVIIPTFPLLFAPSPVLCR